VALNSAWMRETEGSPNRRCELQKSSQLFIRTHNKALSVAAMRVCNAIDYAKFRSRSHGAVIRVYDEAANVIDMHQQAAGDSKEFELRTTRA
jgi:hypothetical protein